MTGGTIDMQMTTGVSNGIGSEGDDTDLNISGGKINVKGGSSVNSEQFVGSNIFMAKNINVSGGEINVESGANLKLQQVRPVLKIGILMMTLAFIKLKKKHN